MAENKLSTESYKGVRDFYPEDMAIQQYIFSTWSKTALSFGFERYDASILEPAELYKAKGAENAELVNEQTYTFTDRGDRSVTLRPEMTPTLARMIAAKRRELSFPVRWFAIPNVFRYERPQRGRLREHWQLNCDIFGGDTLAADTELISLAVQLLLDFGATTEQFEVRINNRSEMNERYQALGITDSAVQNKITRLNDRFRKISLSEYEEELGTFLDKDTVARVVDLVSAKEETDSTLLQNLKALGITNVVVDRSLARGFDYYTGTIFEIFDTSGQNTRALLGGGRYDNLTAMFSDEPVSGVGFGMGDVTMRDFLETHNLISEKIPPTAPTLMIIPTVTELNLEAEKIARTFRQRELKVAVEISTKKIGKKISDAAQRKVTYIIVVGPDELVKNSFTLKNLETGTEETGTLENLLTFLITSS